MYHKEVSVRDFPELRETKEKPIRFMVGNGCCSVIEEVYKNACSRRVGRLLRDLALPEAVQGFEAELKSIVWSQQFGNLGVRHLCMVWQHVADTSNLCQ